MRWKSLMVVTAFSTILLLGAGVGRAEPAPDVGDMGAEVEECVACHEEHVADFGLGPHAALDVDFVAGVGAASVCGACHGDATAHLEEGGGQGNIRALGEDDTAREKTAVCQTCHATDSPRFAHSAHGRSGLDCSSCHGIHASPWKLIKGSDTLIRTAHQSARVSDSCYDCHGEVFTQFEWNERHRLQEGVLECTSCHNPHEPAPRWRLGGFKQQQCDTCHADKSGPYVFEHGSVRGEGCSSCHTPHGSPNRHLLTFQNVAELCYSCHAMVPGFHSRFVAGSQCTNCHVTIHGSHLDPFFLQ